MRDTSIGEACGQTLWEQGQVAQGQEPAVALPERHPCAAAEHGQPQMLEVPDDRIGEETLEIRRLRLRVPDARHDVRIDTRGTPGTALVGQYDPEMSQRFGKPRVPAAIGHRARPGTARPALQEQQQRQVLMLATRLAHHPIEQPDGCAGHRFTGRVVPPVQGHVYRMILDIPSWDVILRQHRHCAPPGRLSGHQSVTPTIAPPRAFILTHDGLGDGCRLG